MSRGLGHARAEGTTATTTGVVSAVDKWADEDAHHIGMGRCGAECIVTGKRDMKISGCREPDLTRVWLGRVWDVCTLIEKPEISKGHVVLGVFTNAHEIKRTTCGNPGAVARAGDTALRWVIDGDEADSGGGVR
jgi:hypothetical protein